MNASFLGVKQDLFRLGSENEFFYKSANIESTFCQLTDRIRIGRSILMVTGEAGAGKTVLLRKVTNHLGAKVKFFYGQSAEGFPELLYGLCNDLGLKPKNKGIIDDLQLLDDFLSAQKQTNLPIAFCIDDAHLLKDDVLNKLLLLALAPSDDAASFQIILIGLRQLERRISKIVLPQSEQFNIVCFRLESLDAQGVGGFIKQKLEAVDYRNVLFMPDAILRIAELSNGIPRLVNKICNSALSAADAGITLTVTAEMIDRVVNPKAATEQIGDGSKSADNIEHGTIKESNSLIVQAMLTDTRDNPSAMEGLKGKPRDSNEILAQLIEIPPRYKTGRRFTWGLAALLVLNIGIYYFYRQAVPPTVSETTIASTETGNLQNNVKIEKDAGDLGGSDQATLILQEPSKAEEIAQPGASARQSILDEENRGQPIDLNAIYDHAEKSIERGQPIDAYLLYYYAAKRGHGNASFKLAQLSDPATFKPGLSLIETPNVTQANKWYSKAGEAGHPKANHFLTQLRDQVTKRAALGDEKSRRLLLQFQE